MLFMIIFGVILKAYMPFMEKIEVSKFQESTYAGILITVTYLLIRNSAYYQLNAIKNNLNLLTIK